MLFHFDRRAAGPLFVALLLASLPPQSHGEPPEVGDTLQDHEFKTLDGKKLRLTDLGTKGGVVLVILRGFPGYQCPICTQQVAELRKRANDFMKAGATVILVYPGEAANLGQHAKDFTKRSPLPAPLVLVTDPDFKFISQLDLRWDAKGETAYPSTFVLDADRKVVFAKISKTHGDRASTEEVLEAASRLRKGEALTK
jgi:peroxiredoxin